MCRSCDGRSYGPAYGHTNPFVFLLMQSHLHTLIYSIFSHVWHSTSQHQWNLHWQRYCVTCWSLNSDIMFASDLQQNCKNKKSPREPKNSPCCSRASRKIHCQSHAAYSVVPVCRECPTSNPCHKSWATSGRRIANCRFDFVPFGRLCRYYCCWVNFVYDFSAAAGLAAATAVAQTSHRCSWF